MISELDTKNGRVKMANGQKGTRRRKKRKLEI